MVAKERQKTEPHYLIDIIHKTITFMKIRNHAKYKRTNVPSHLPIFD